MDRYDASDQHLVFEGVSDGIDNKFGLESIFYAMGFLTWIITVALFFDLFLTSITSPILYNTFAPVRRRRSLSDINDENRTAKILLLLDNPQFKSSKNKRTNKKLELSLSNNYRANKGHIGISRNVKPFYFDYELLLSTTIILSIYLMTQSYLDTI